MSQKLKLGVVLLLVVSSAWHSIAADEAKPAQSAPEESCHLGERVLGVIEALEAPGDAGSMEAVMALGSDSRYYVMVRGWLSMKLEGDRSIAEARDGELSDRLRQRIEFLEAAIRALDLE